MASSVTLAPEADVATRRDSALAAGLGNHLPIGYWSGAIYRSAIRFPVPAGWAGWTGITKATLSFSISDFQHVGPANSSIYIRANGGTIWVKSQGTQNCESGFSAGNNTQAADLAVTTTNQVSFASGSTANARKSVTVTGIVQAMWSGGVPKLVFVFDPVDSSDYSELWSMDKGSTTDPSLYIEYETVSPPLAPSLTYPADGTSVPEVRPRFAWVHHDPDPQADAIVVVKQGATTLATLHPALPTDQFVTCNVDLPRGVAIDYTVQTADATGLGPTAHAQFSVLTPPVVTIGPRAMTYDAVAQLPRLVANWSCPTIQTTYRVQTASGYDSGILNGAVQSFVIPRNLTNGTAETVTVTVNAGGPNPGTASAAFTPRWGLTTQHRDLIAAPVAWGQPIIATAGPIPVGASMPIEYGSDPASSTVPSAWFPALSSVPLARHLFWRAWFIPNATQSPVLDTVTIPTSTVNPLVDNWLSPRNGPALAAPWRIDAGESVYGTRSMRCDVTGAGPFYVYSAPIQLRAGRTYVLTGLMKSQGNSGAQFQLQDASGAAGGPGTVLLGGGMVLPPNSPVQSDALVGTKDWYTSGTVRDTNRYKTPTYLAAADMTVYVVLKTGGAAGAVAWFDAIKLEESTVATPWSPGALGAVVLDAGGLQVDANKGGVFRVKGSTGGARDTVESGPNGLRLGGDTDLSSPTAGGLSVNGVPVGLARAVQIVRGPTATTALTNAEADLPQLTLTVGPGTFLITGIFSFDISATNPSICSGRLSIDGVTQAAEAQFLLSSTTTGRSTVQMVWPVTIAGAGVLKLRALKALATGTAQAVAGQCALIAQQVS